MKSRLHIDVYRRPLHVQRSSDAHWVITSFNFKIHQIRRQSSVECYGYFRKDYYVITVCSCHVTYAFHSESTLYSCLNGKELLARSRREIWSLSDCNWTRTHNRLVRKRTLKQLASSASLAEWFLGQLNSWIVECSFTN